MNRFRIAIGLFSVLLLAGPAAGQSSAPATSAASELSTSRKENVTCPPPTDQQPTMFDVRKYSLIGNGVHAAKALHTPGPEYPEAARKANLNYGAVSIALAINETGRIDDVRIACASDLAFAQKALEALTQWRFAPGNKDGNPVAVQEMVDFTFGLR